MNAAEYKKAMAGIDAGGKVDRETFGALVDYAKRRKVRRPGEDAVRARRDKRAVNSGADCSADGCSKPARARGMCSAHHTAWWRAQDPERMERTREASRRYAARKRAERDAERAAVSG